MTFPFPPFRSRVAPRIAALLAGAMMSAVSLHAQQPLEYSRAAEEVFRGGVASFEGGKYAEALVAFDRIVQQYPSCQRTTAALVMKGKTLLRLNESIDAAKTLKLFLERFPESSYIADADLMLGQIYVSIGRYEDAMDWFSKSWDALPRPAGGKLWRELLVAMDSTIDSHLPVASVQRLLDQSRDASRRAYFWLKVGERYAAANRVAAAAAAIDTLTARYPGNPYAARIALLRGRITQRLSVKLGVLAPLMRSSEPSALRDIGNEVYDGIEAALNEYALDPGSRVRITLVPEDTERDTAVAVREARVLADDKDIVGIIGPVFSSSSLAAARAIGSAGIPLVTPTANANGIAACGPAVFQANPDYAMRGRAMARYAVERKGFKTLAVLAPGDTYGRYLAEGFIDEVNRLGGKIVAAEWYDHGVSDLKAQITEIRRAGFREGSEPIISFSGRVSRANMMRLLELGVPLARLDSLMEAGGTVAASALLGPTAKARIDSAGLGVLYDESRVDSTEYPLTGIQGIYLPISAPEEIGVVSSQLVFFNIQTQMLGSGEWYAFRELDANKRYCKGVIFESDTYIDTSGAPYRDFSSAFGAQFKKAPTRNNLYGYDIAMLLTGLIREGATTRAALAHALGNVQDYRGLHSRIGFTPGRVNGWLHILQYRSDTILHLDEIGVNLTAKTQINGEPTPR